MATHSSNSQFAECMSHRATTIVDRAVSFLYFYSVTNDSGASLKQLKIDFEAAGLASPNVTKLRKSISQDKRTAKVSKDVWRLRADKRAEIEARFGLDDCLAFEEKKKASLNGSFVDGVRVEALRGKNIAYDLSRLLQMLTELDHAYAAESYISVTLIVRAILDHVPPLFGLGTFAEVVNNYKGTKSFKDSINHLENSSRKIADSYLHTRIRSKETLPTKTQVNFSNDLDVLLAEIVRIT